MSLKRRFNTLLGKNNNGIWKVKLDDNYSMDDLIDIRNFFLDDLNRSEKELVKMKKWEKYKLPRVSKMVEILGYDLWISQQNVLIVNNMIEKLQSKNKKDVE